MKALTEGGGTGLYTDSQLEERLLASSATIGVRYELLDRRLNPIASGDAGHLTTVDKATIDVDGSRLVNASLKLSMLPDSRLDPRTFVPFSRYVRPWWRLQMLDGGWAEWPMGVYVWTRPKVKRVGKGVERWELVLGDLSHLLTITGPDLGGYQVGTQAVVTSAVTDVYQRALGYLPDTSGIVLSQALAAGTLQWSIVPASGGAPGTTPTGATPLRGVPATSWQNVLQTLHASIGYQPPRVDWLGVPVARPFPLNLFSEPAARTFTLDQDSLVEPNIDEQPRLDLFANYVVAIAQNASANAYQGQAIADANDYLPGHLWSEARCGVRVGVVIPNAGAGDARALLASAVGELYVRMASVAEVSAEIQMWPGLEPWDVLGLDLDGYDLTPRFLASAYSIDLGTGKIKLKLPQITGIVEALGVSDYESPRWLVDHATGDWVVVDTASGDYVLVG